MNYTTNYHLPQWAETDRIQMEDFNQAMADIDEGLSETYGPERKAYVSGEVTIYGDTPTGTLVTFDFEPSFVVVHGGSPALILQGESGRISDSYTYMEAFTHSLTLQLYGNQLRLSSRQSQATLDVSLSYVAFQ